MPTDVHELYEEARTTAATSRRAGAALARATVEKLIKALDPEASKSASLEKRIQRIRPKLTPDTARMLDVLRITANGAVHVDDDPDDLVIMALSDTEGPKMLEMFLSAANDVTEEMITRPRSVDSYWDRLPATVREKIERENSSTSTPTT